MWVGRGNGLGLDSLHNARYFTARKNRKRGGDDVSGGLLGVRFLEMRTGRLSGITALDKVYRT